LILKYPVLGPTFGNPNFESKGIYTQDKVQTLGAALKNAPEAEAKKIINGYIDLILLHWQYGISERVFNCTVNNGIGADGAVILLDFGEVSFSKKSVESRIIAKRWLKSFSYKDFPKEFQDYYGDRLAKKLTTHSLDKLWGAALTN